MRNPGSKALAVLIALVTWWWVQGQELAVARVRVPVDFVFASDRVNVDPLPSAVTLTVEGSRAATRRAREGEVRLEVDLSEERTGGEVLLDAYPISGLPGGLTILDYDPRRVRIRIDERTTRNVAVEPFWLGNADGELAVTSVTVEPDVARVSGPRAVLDVLDTVRIKPIDLSGMAESGVVAVELDLPRGVTTDMDWDGVAHVSVEPREGAITFQSVPVVVTGSDAWQVAEGSETIRVELVGPSKILRTLRADRIVARVEVPDDLTGFRATARYQSPTLPRLDVLVAGPESVRVKQAPKSVELVRR